MWRTYQFFIPLLSLFLNRVDLTDLYPLSFQVKLLKVLDADTVVVKFSNQILKVRFSKIDAPELGQPFWHGRGDAGLEALKCAERVIGSKKYFHLNVFGQDMYRRILGDLDNLSYEFINHGCTSLYEYSKFFSRKEKGDYLRSLERAKTHRIGIWKRGGYLRPNLWRKKKKKMIFGKI